MRRLAAALCLLLLLAGTAPAAAQTTSRPGPWVLDIRGVTSPVPEEPVFYPTLDTTALVPSRGFGLDAGAHVYLFNLGGARIGVGLDAVNVRAITRPPPAAAGTGGTGTETGTTTTARQQVQTDVRLFAPQISFNFGTRDGWSYVSAGYGTAEVVTKTAVVNPARRQSERVDALNVGGGARWFFMSHLAFGFDVRLHRVGAGTAGPIGRTGPPPPAEEPPQTPPAAPEPLPPTPGRMSVVVGVGFSIR